MFVPPVEEMMGTILPFPEVRRAASRALPSEPAIIVILPVVRIERQDESRGEPTGGLDDTGGASRGKRRRRASRS